MLYNMKLNDSKSLASVPTIGVIQNKVVPESPHETVVHMIYFIRFHKHMLLLSNKSVQR